MGKKGKGEGEGERERETMQGSIYSIYIKDPSKHLLNKDYNYMTNRVQVSNLTFKNLLNLVLSKRSISF